MSQHPSARLTPKGRERMVERIEAGEPVSEVARQVGVSRRTAGKWLARARAGEPMADRPSRPRTLAKLTPPDVEDGVCEALAASAIAFSASRGVAVERVVADNGPGYRSRLFNESLEARGVRHKHTRPFSPWQNGRVERMNRTLAREWRYARAWGSEASRAEALGACMGHCNWGRPHGACGDLPRVTDPRRKQRHGTQQLTVWSQQANRHCRSGPGEPTACARGAFPGRR